MRQQVTDDQNIEVATNRQTDRAAVRDAAVFGRRLLPSCNGSEESNTTPTTDARLQLAQASKPTPAEKLERQLLHAIAMEKRAASRVKRASTILLKWQRMRRRVERRIGQQQVREVMNRLRLGIGDDGNSK